MIQYSIVMRRERGGWGDEGRKISRKQTEKNSFHLPRTCIWIEYLFYLVRLTQMTLL